MSLLSFFILMNDATYKNDTYPLTTIMSTEIMTITIRHALQRKQLLIGLLLVSSSSVFADSVRVSGEHCPKGYTHVTYEQVKTDPKQYCNQLKTWDIARLANGGSMDGSGYQCKIRASDERKLGHSLCEKEAAPVVQKTKSLNQAAYVPNSTEYKFGYNSIPNMLISGAPADTGYGRFAMLHDGSVYRLYLFKKGSKDTLYQFGFNPSTQHYEYGYKSIKKLKIVGMPADADHRSFAMLHDGKDYRLYMRSRNNKAKLYQAAYKPNSNQYVYGYRSIPSMDIANAPKDITHNKRWAMLHDGKAYRLYIGKKKQRNTFYQFAFNRQTNRYEFGFNNAIPTLTAVGTPNNSKKNNFAMLHDGQAYRYYYKTK